MNIKLKHFLVLSDSPLHISCHNTGTTPSFVWFQYITIEFIVLIYVPKNGLTAIIPQIYYARK